MKTLSTILVLILIILSVRFLNNDMADQSAVSCDKSFIVEKITEARYRSVVAVSTTGVMGLFNQSSFKVGDEICFDSAIQNYNRYHKDMK